MPWHHPKVWTIEIMVESEKEGNKRKTKLVARVQPQPINKIVGKIDLIVGKSSFLRSTIDSDRSPRSFYGPHHVPVWLELVKVFQLMFIDFLLLFQFIICCNCSATIWTPSTIETRFRHFLFYLKFYVVVFICIWSYIPSIHYNT